MENHQQVWMITHLMFYCVIQKQKDMIGLLLHVILPTQFLHIQMQSGLYIVVFNFHNTLSLHSASLGGLT